MKIRWIAIILAVTMLATIFVGCDEPDEPDDEMPGTEDTEKPGTEDTEKPDDPGTEEPGNKEDSENPDDEALVELPDQGVEGVDFNVPVYEKLEVEEFNTKPYNMHSCGQVFLLLNRINLGEMITGPSNSETLLSHYDQVLNSYSDAESFKNINSMFDPFFCSAINNMANANKSRQTFYLKFDDKYNSGWNHKLVSTDYNFALVSTDQDGNIFFTGFVNGRLENDLGFISQDTTKIIKEVAKRYSYNDIVNIARQEMFAYIYKEISKDEKDIMVGANFKFRDEEENVLHPYLWEGKFTSFIIINPTGGPDLEGRFKYDIPEDYFDQLFDTEMVVDGTIAVDPVTQMHYVPGHIKKED